MPTVYNWTEHKDNDKEFLSKLLGDVEGVMIPYFMSGCEKAPSGSAPEMLGTFAPMILGQLLHWRGAHQEWSSESEDRTGLPFLNMKRRRAKPSPPYP